MKTLFALLILLSFPGIKGSSQEKFITRTGNISFLSETMLENIFGESKEASSLIDHKTGEIVFSIPIKSFHFKLNLMEEHFNENYMESDKFPKAVFSGKLEEFNQFKMNVTTPQTFKVSGEMTIHGVKQQMTATATITASSKNKFQGETSFRLKPADYSIKIPSAVGMKIAEEVEVKVKADYESYIK